MDPCVVNYASPQSRIGEDVVQERIVGEVDVLLKALTDNSNKALNLDAPKSGAPVSLYVRPLRMQQLCR